MAGSRLELALKKRFEIAYARSIEPVMQNIERSVCGCDYGGNSWTTKKQADDLIGLLDLGPDRRLIDLGAGTGWPGLYLAQQTGCPVTLVDLPEIGLQIAEKRARADGIGERAFIYAADASDLPFDTASFDAISHSDLLCCLMPKRKVLEECRRLVHPEGCMVFSVIFIRPGIHETQYGRALANAPDFVEIDQCYDTLLTQTGWQIAEKFDLTDDYRQSCARQVKADTAHQRDLVRLLGVDAAEERLAGWYSKLSAIEEGLFLRELYSCRPC